MNWFVVPRPNSAQACSLGGVLCYLTYGLAAGPAPSRRIPSGQLAKYVSRTCGRLGETANLSRLFVIQTSGVGQVNRASYPVSRPVPIVGIAAAVQSLTWRQTSQPSRDTPNVSRCADRLARETTPVRPTRDTSLRGPSDDRVLHTCWDSL